MTRVSPRLLFLLGALLLALWFASPLSSSPPVRSASPTPAAAPAPLPELDDMNHEVDRLEARLAQPIRPEAPDRDPFQFASSAPVSQYVRPADPSAAVETAPATIPIAWPRLVAIVTAAPDGTAVRRAVFEDTAALVRIRQVGDVHGDITVSAITEGAVTLVHTPSGRSTTLTLR